jgi:hypothetical protein
LFQACRDSSICEYFGNRPKEFPEGFECVLTRHHATPDRLIDGKRPDGFLPGLKSSAQEALMPMICHLLPYRRNLPLCLLTIYTGVGEDLGIADPAIGLDEAVS